MMITNAFLVSYQTFKSIKTHPERIKKQINKWLMMLIMKVLNFPCLEKIIVRLNKKDSICINVFCCEINLVYPVYISDQKFEIIWIYC